jgi:hypothetical protein
MENKSAPDPFLALQAKMENPLNRMVVEDRKRKKYGKGTGVLSAILGADILVMAIASRSAFQGLETLSTGKVSAGTFVLLDVIGAAAAVLTGFLLLKFKHFSKVSFAVTCGFAIFFGLTLPLTQYVRLTPTSVVPTAIAPLVLAEGVVALALTGAVMVLSIFSA